MSKIDSSLTHNNIMQVQLTCHKKLIRFIKTHCHKCTYFFQV